MCIFCRLFKKKKKDDDFFPNLSVKKLKKIIFLNALNSEILYQEIIKKDFHKH